MKRIFTLLLLAVTVLTACEDGQTSALSETPTDTESADTAVPEEKEKIETIEEMIKLDSVLSVSKIEEFCTSSVSAYKVDFEVDGLKRYAEIALPNDYERNTYPTVLYFPDVGYGVNYLVDNFAKKDVTVIRMFSRGSKGNEGQGDFCGNDFADSEKLLELCVSCDFLSDSGIFTVGAVTGSTHALKLASVYPDTVVGCAVVDVICDYEAFANEQGEQITELFLSSIGCSREELPMELAKRSPKNFYETVKAPILMFCYEESPIVFNTQSEMMRELLIGNGNDAELQYLNPVSSDFNGTALMKLIPWIKGVSENLK